MDQFRLAIVKVQAILPRWLPAIFMMAIIFYFSSRPGDALPDFHDLDYLVKKAGHVIGYSLLAISLWYALGEIPRRFLSAWVLAVVFAAGDEIHQSFVPGRSATIIDVLIFDGFGALAGLYFLKHFLRRCLRAGLMDLLKFDLNFLVILPFIHLFEFDFAK